MHKGIVVRAWVIWNFTIYIFNNIMHHVLLDNYLLGKEIIFSVALVCLFFSVWYQYYSKSYEEIAMKFYKGVRIAKRNKWLDFGSSLDHHANCPIGNPAITQQIMNRFWWNAQASSAMIQRTIDSTGVVWIIMLTFQIGNPCKMRVMSCFNQGVLHSPSALVLYVIIL